MSILKHLSADTPYGIALNDAGHQVVVFNADFFKQLLGPVVYVLKNSEQEVLYVGSSAHGLSRVTHLTHIAVRKSLELGCNLAVILVASVSEARHVEAQLIEEFKPRYNIVGKDPISKLGQSLKRLEQIHD